MIRAVARRPMSMAPPLVMREQSLERGKQIVVGARAELHDHDARCGVRDEDRQQAVTGAGHEPLALGGDVEQAATRAGMDGDLDRSHRQVWPRDDRSPEAPQPLHRQDDFVAGFQPAAERLILDLQQAARPHCS